MLKSAIMNNLDNFFPSNQHIYRQLIDKYLTLQLFLLILPNKATIDSNNLSDFSLLLLLAICFIPTPLTQFM